ncbi:hypothetical protein FRC17_002857 [Serendipita sp. 399]|nr:hypothetical protein FRC17_002857 [Serendipita sp. 399]
MREAKEDEKPDAINADKRKSRKGKRKERAAVGMVPELSRATIAPISKDGIQPWKWFSLADSRVSKQAAIFTNDAKYFFIPASSSVKIYSSATGKVVSTLRSHSRASSGSSDRVTCLMINPSNSFQLLTGSGDGVLRVWDYIDAVLLRSIDVGHPISHLCAHREMEDRVFLISRKPSKSGNAKAAIEEGYAVMRVSLRITTASIRETIQKSTEINIIGKVRSPVGMGVAPSGKWLVIAGGNKIYITQVSNIKFGLTKFSCPDSLTCLSFHPTEDWFATGDDLGQIRLWYYLRDDLTFEKASRDKSAPTTTLHWHAHAVQALEFTPNGAYLLSGGEESVLVIWQLHSGKKEFVPRVGAPIRTISIYDTGDGTQEQEYVLGLSDGTLAFVKSSTLKLSRTIARVKLEAPYFTSNSTIPLTMHAKSRNLFLPSSHPSSLQIYSPVTSSLLLELEVSPSNRISRPYAKPLEPCRVNIIAISDCGNWLGTIDSRDGSAEGFGLEVCLRIWHWEESDQLWDLNTRIDQPHGNYAVNSLSFNPAASGQDLMLASTGDDNQIKTWCIRTTQTKDEHTVHWVLRSTFSYRNQRPTQALWCPDGTVLAVAQTSCVTLWTVKTNTMFATLTNGEVNPITRIVFAGKNGRYICAATHSAFALFDLLRVEVTYTFRSRQGIKGLFSWAGSDTFAISREPWTVYASGPAVRNETIFSFFSVFSATPISQRNIPHALRECIAWQPQQPGLDSKLSFVAVTLDGSLVHIGDEDIQNREASDDPRSLGQVATSSAQPSLFQDIFGKSAVLDYSTTPQAANKYIPDLGSSHPQTEIDWGLLDGPSHLLPPASILFEPLLTSMLLRAEMETTPVVTEDPTPVHDIMVIDVPESSNRRHSTGRTITDQEINELVDLFRDPSFRGPRGVVQKLKTPPRLQKHPEVNGKPKTNGLTNGHHAAMETSPLKLNGIHRSTKNMDTSDTSEPTHPPSQIPMPTIGKKRKKALMA